MNLILASNNTKKLAELSALLAPLGWSLQTQGALGIPEAEEPHPGFVENALAKARHAARLGKMPALADDSGLCVAALGGAPGVHSARYAGKGAGDAANNAKLLDALSGVADRRAFFYCALVLVRHADDPCPVIAEGFWHGEILDAPRGANGFGYDPLFLVPELGQSSAELIAEEKNRRSHRGQALAALARRCEELRIKF
ncbi:MAG: RdgB/HAM1 family non-canonical purine NTP pyrophosphatase [Betaproteobacteria bacterium]|nr:RdgB/HAM1 family non-canonical purine NTP pyrophosphatase [Betaproteobacteria bacterium]